MAWWPLRWLKAQGLHPLWSTVLIYGLVVMVLTLWRPLAWRELVRTPALWLLMIAAGVNNTAFNVAVTQGDVVRVMLLFYLMPLWAVLLARALLGERLSALAGLRVALALAGAATVLKPAGSGLPLPADGAEWLAVLAGFSFALNNVWLRREAQRSVSARSLAMFAGGGLVASVACAVLSASGQLSASLPETQAPWLWGVAGLALCFLAANMALQFGAARLPAHVTAVVMVSEVLFATASAVALGAGTLDGRTALGGLMILSAALLSAWRR